MYFFGETTFAARFPFALLGIISIYLSYILLCSWGQSQRRALLAVFLLVCNVPFILLMRQCRYYAPALVFTLITLIGYDLLVKHKKHGVLMTIIGLVGLYHSFYVFFFIMILVLGLHWLFFTRKNIALKQLLLVASSTMAFTLPFFLYFKEWSRNFDYSHGYSSIAKFSSSLHTNFLFINNFNIPLILVFIAAIITLREKQGLKKTFLVVVVCLMTLISFAFPEELPMRIIFLIGFISLIIHFYHAVYRKTDIDTKHYWHSLVFGLISISLLIYSAVSLISYYRYLITLLPIFCFFVAIITEIITKKRPVFMILLLFLLVTTNLIHLASIRLFKDPSSLTQYLSPSVVAKNALGQKFDYKPLPMCLNDRTRYPLFDYLFELAHEYQGPNEAIVAYLDDKISPESLIKAHYEDFTLMFYLDARFSGPVDKKTTDIPDFIVIRPKDYVLHAPEMLEGIKKSTYKQVILPAVNLPWNNRPSPLYHHFWTVKNGQKVVILQRIK